MQLAGRDVGVKRVLTPAFRLPTPIIWIRCKGVDFRGCRLFRYQAIRVAPVRGYPTRRPIGDVPTRVAGRNRRNPTELNRRSQRGTSDAAVSGRTAGLSRHFMPMCRNGGGNPSVPIRNSPPMAAGRSPGPSTISAAGGCGDMSPQSRPVPTGGPPADPDRGCGGDPECRRR